MKNNSPFEFTPGQPTKTVSVDMEFAAGLSLERLLMLLEGLKMTMTFENLKNRLTTLSKK